MMPGMMPPMGPFGFFPPQQQAFGRFPRAPFPMPGMPVFPNQV